MSNEPMVTTTLRPSSTIKNSKDIDNPQQETVRRIWKNLFSDNTMKTTQGHQNRTRYTQIKLKMMVDSNLPFGNDVHEKCDGEKIIFHNINGIKDDGNWHQIMSTMSEIRADVFGFAEINRTLNDGEKQRWANITKKFFRYSQSAHSESNINLKNYKPGGTMTTITGKWQARVTKQGQDERGLGRWSYIQLNSNKNSLVIITAYRPCVSQGPSTAWMQQWTLLRESGMKDPDPIKIFYTDLEKFLAGWIAKGTEIILMLDANETIGEKPGGLARVLGKIGLTDLLQHHHPNNGDQYTYARGSKQIDYILGTAKVRSHCTRAGLLPFGTGYHSDHRAVFIVVNITAILKTLVNSIDTITARKLIQASPKERKMFLKEADKHFSNQNLYNRLKKLMSIQETEWGPTNIEEYEHCDREMITGMLYAERQTRKIKTTAWSPKFAQAVSIKAFWKIALSQK
jgi:exonuclease III